MNLPRFSLKLVWGAVSVVGIGGIAAGAAVVGAGEFMDTREHLRPTAQCSVTTDEWVASTPEIPGHFKVISFYTSWNSYDPTPDDTDFRPYMDPFPEEIENAERLGQPVPLGGAEQALTDCIAFIDERQGVGLRNVQVNTGTADENGFSFAIPLGQRPVDYEGAKETSRYRLGNKWAANDAIEKIEDHLDLVEARRRAFDAQDNAADNALIQVQRRVRKGVTERAQTQDGSWSAWGWGLLEHVI